MGWITGQYIGPCWKATTGFDDDEDFDRLLAIARQFETEMGFGVSDGCYYLAPININEADEPYDQTIPIDVADMEEKMTAFELAHSDLKAELENSGFGPEIAFAVCHFNKL